MYKKTMGESMRRNNFFDQHTLDIFKAAMPHIHPMAQNSVNVLLKANDLISTISGAGREDELSTMDLENWQPNPEEMLLSIKEVLNEGETEMVDMMLNFMKARRIYSAYQSYNENVLQTQAVGGSGNSMGNGGRRNPFGMGGMNNRRNNSANRGNNMNSNSNDGQARMQGHNNQAAAMNNGNMQGQNFMNFLMSQLSPEQRKTFEMFNMMMNNMPMDNGNVSGQSVRREEKKADVTSQELADNEENSDESEERG